MKLLICSDSSDAADRATRMGAIIAEACQAQVTLLGIAENDEHGAAVLETLRQAQKELESRKIAVELVTKAGDPIEEIVQRTRENAYDLVVIGAARKASRGHLWRSSKTYKIIKSVPPPVLSVMGSVANIKRILICSGGKKYINNAVALTGTIARALEASVTLMHVLPELPALYSRLHEAETNVEALLSSKSALGRALAGQKSTLEALGIPPTMRLRQGSTLDGIFKEMRSGDYDLVVTGSSLSHGSLHTYVLGDVTREIVNRTERAVMVVRAETRPKTFRDWWHLFTHSGDTTTISKPK